MTGAMYGAAMSGMPTALGRAAEVEELVDLLKGDGLKIYCPSQKFLRRDLKRQLCLLFAGRILI